MARRIEQQTKGALRFTLAALYPMLYRMEQRGWIRGAWEISASGRRKRCYRLTPAGKKKLSPAAEGMGGTFRRAAATDQGVACVIGRRSLNNILLVFPWSQQRGPK